MRNPNRQTHFQFRQFTMSNCRSAMKIGTDGVLLGAWAFNQTQHLTTKNDANKTDDSMMLLDVGAGTGVIALILAQRFPDSRITAVEIDCDAAQEGSENFAGSPWTDRLTMIQTDFTCFVPTVNPESIDAVVSNPPYFTTGAHAPDAKRLAARHEGLLNLNSLMEGSSIMLKPSGRLAIIIPAEQRSRAEFAATLNGLCTTRICEVCTVPTKPPRRVMMEFMKSDATAPTDISRLYIANSNGIKTPEYLNLVHPFYIRQ